MKTNQWKIIEEFVLNDPRFDSDDFEEYLEVVNRGNIWNTIQNRRCENESKERKI